MFGITGQAHFIRTTDKHHMESAQYFWKLVAKNEASPYKKITKQKYCIRFVKVKKQILGLE